MVKKNRIVKNPNKFKKILVFSIIALCVSAFLFLPNVVFADSTSEVIQNDLYADQLSKVISIVSHIVYVFIWPCLAIAGSALDNSLIYGSFLHLDTALRNIRNIMKNFANFTLGFVFIFSIVKNLFAGSFGNSSNDPVKSAKDTVVKTFIAGVLVQMSWFLMEVLIDLSTILIYAVGGIPLSMLGTYDNYTSTTPIMQLNMEFDSNNLSYYYSYGGHNYTTCLLANKGGDVADRFAIPWLSGEYIVGRSSLYMPDGISVFETGYCVLNGYLYKYVESSGFFNGYYEKTGQSVSQRNEHYLRTIKSYYGWDIDSGAVLQARNDCSLIKAYNIEYTGGANEPCHAICPGYGEVPYTGDVFSGGQFTLAGLMENSKGWVGPFITMYSSILRYQDLVINQNNDSTLGKLFGLLINTFFALVLFIPIAILTFLLVIRIGTLWIVVAISPIIVLVEYGLDKGIKDKLKLNDFKFSVGKIVKLIFSPVVVVFTVSLCIVFLANIYDSKPNPDSESTTLSAFGIEPVRSAEESGSSTAGGNNTGSGCFSTGINNVSKETYSILGVVEISMDVQNYNHGISMFAWVLLEILATAMVWFFMKFAIGFMGEKGEKLMKSAEEFIGSVPIIPLPNGKGAIGINKLKDMGAASIMERYTNDMNRTSEDVLREAFPWAYPRYTKPKDNKSSGGVSATEINNVVNEINVSINGGKSAPSFSELSPTSKETLIALYGNETKAQEKYINEFVPYHTDNAYSEIRTKGTTLSGTSTKNMTNADAIRFNHAQLDAAVRSDSNWINWASGMVAGSVQTSDGIFMVDYLGGTAVPGNQQYEVVDRTTYEERHFGNQTLQTVSTTEYNKYKQEVDNYIKQLQEELDELNRINSTNPAERTQDDQDKLSALNKLGITQAELDEIRSRLGINN